MRLKPIARISKMKKKISIIVLTFMLSCFMLIDGADAKEKTLNQLEAEAKANREAYNKAKNQKELNEQERAAAIKQKENVQQEIKNISAQLKQIEQEVMNLQKSIDKKDKEIKIDSKNYQFFNLIFLNYHDNFLIFQLRHQ